MQEMQFQSASWENPPEKEMTTYSSVLAWKIPGTEEPGTLQSRGHKEPNTTDWLCIHIHVHVV